VLDPIPPAHSPHSACSHRRAGVYLPCSTLYWQVELHAQSSSLPGSKLQKTSWRHRLPFFYGWMVLASAVIILAITNDVYYSFSVFYVALLEETSWSRGETATVFSVFVLVTAFAGIPGGALIDRLGPSRVVPLGGGLRHWPRIHSSHGLHQHRGPLRRQALWSDLRIRLHRAGSRWSTRRLGGRLCLRRHRLLPRRLRPGCGLFPLQRPLSLVGRATFCAESNGIVL